MKIMRVSAAALVCLLGCLVGTTEPANAQSTVRPTPRVVASCGTPPYSYAVGDYQWALIDQNGNGCVSGTISASLAGFTPAAGATANVTDIVNTSQDIALPVGTDAVVTNKGTVDVNFRIQVGAGTAVSTDQTLKAGAATGIHVGTATHLSVIAPTGTGTGATAGQLNIQGGSGLAAGYGGGGGASSGGGGAVTVADGADVTLGAKADTAVTNPASTASGIALSKGQLTELAAINTNTTGASTAALQTTGNTSAATTATNTGTIAGAITSSVVQSNTKQVNGVTTLAGAGAVGTGAQRVAVGQDTTTIAGSAPGTAGTPSANVVTVQGATSGGTAIPASITTALPAGTNVIGHVICDSGCSGSGGTSSNFGSAFPTAGTAIGFSDGTNLVAGTIKAANTAPTATDKAIVVAISPNGVNPNGQTTMSASAPVTIASDQSAVAVGVTNSSGAHQAVIGCDSSVVYDASTNGSTQLVALSSGKSIYVCGYTLFSAGTVNVELDYGTGTACATSPTKIVPAFQLTAQTGAVDPSTFYRGLKTAASNELCLKTSAGVAVQGIIYFSQF